MNDTIASEALAAAVGGAVSSGVLYPLEVLKTRMQADDATTKEDSSTTLIENNGSDNEKSTEEETKEVITRSSTSIDYARNLYRSEGMGVFFDGIEVSAIQSAIEKACYFFAYTALKKTYSHTRSKGSHPQKLSAVASVLLGCLAEWAHLPVTLPIDALTTAIQTSGAPKKIDGATDKQKQTILALWMVLWKEKSFYKGIQAYWILCFKPALQYTIFEQCKAVILRLKRGRNERRSSNLLSAGEAFLLGMFARTVATLAVFPFVRAKVRMQKLAQAPGEEASKASPTIWKMISDNYTDGGLQALYQGLGPELTRGVLSAALMMMVKERISGGVKIILHGSRST